MNIDELTIGQAKELVKTFSCNQIKEESFFVIGKNYIIRTVTMINIGTIKNINEQELLLSEASWIADTGRYNKALESGELNEVEKYPDAGICIIGRGSIVDAQPWTNKLPKKTK